MQKSVLLIVLVVAGASWATDVILYEERNGAKHEYESLLITKRGSDYSAMYCKGNLVQGKMHYNYATEEVPVAAVEKVYIAADLSHPQNIADENDRIGPDDQVKYQLIVMRNGLTRVYYLLEEDMHQEYSRIEMNMMAEMWKLIAEYIEHIPKPKVEILTDVKPIESIEIEGEKGFMLQSVEDKNTYYQVILSCDPIFCKLVLNDDPKSLTDNVAQHYDGILSEAESFYFMAKIDEYITESKGLDAGALDQFGDKHRNCYSLFRVKSGQYDKVFYQRESEVTEHFINSMIGPIHKIAVEKNPVTIPNKSRVYLMRQCW